MPKTDLRYLMMHRGLWQLLSHFGMIGADSNLFGGDDMIDILDFLLSRLNVR